MRAFYIRIYFISTISGTIKVTALSRQQSHAPILHAASQPITRLPRGPLQRAINDNGRCCGELQYELSSNTTSINPLHLEGNVWKGQEA
jgi:hypothetical protein